MSTLRYNSWFVKAGLQVSSTSHRAISSRSVPVQSGLHMIPAIFSDVEVSRLLILYSPLLMLYKHGEGPSWSSYRLSIPYFTHIQSVSVFSFISHLSCLCSSSFSITTHFPGFNGSSSGFRTHLLTYLPYSVIPRPSSTNSEEFLTEREWYISLMNSCKMFIHTT